MSKKECSETQIYASFPHASKISTNTTSTTEISLIRTTSAKGANLSSDHWWRLKFQYFEGSFLPQSVESLRVLRFCVIVRLSNSSICMIKPHWLKLWKIKTFFSEVYCSGLGWSRFVATSKNTRMTRNCKQCSFKDCLKQRIYYILSKYLFWLTMEIILRHDRPLGSSVFFLGQYLFASN